MARHVTGIKIQYDADGTGVYTDVSELVSFTPPDGVTTDSPGHNINSAGRIKATIAGMISLDTMSMLCRYNTAQYIALLAIQAAGTTYYWRIQFPLLTGQTTQGDRVDFQGYLSRVGGPAGGDDDTVNQTIDVKPTTLPTITVGS